MTFFFEVLTKKIGLSRIGRLSMSKSSKNYIKTPITAIPLRKSLITRLNYMKEFENHNLFIISEEKQLESEFLEDKYKNTGFIYYHYGTIEKFREILEERVDLFMQNEIISIIPFNNPTTIISKDFAIDEIKYFLERTKTILKKNNNHN